MSISLKKKKQKKKKKKKKKKKRVVLRSFVCPFPTNLASAGFQGTSGDSHPRSGKLRQSHWFFRVALRLAARRTSIKPPEAHLF